jgi:hypothetical protein
MKIQVTPLTEREIPEAVAFNARVEKKAPFLLPAVVEPGPVRDRAASPAISSRHYVALEDSRVRGGFLLVDQPAWINGEVRRAGNSQSMLSEGICDRKYGMVSLHMLKYLEGHSPYIYMVGMGGEQNPLPRLLKGAGWKVRPVPFLFRVQAVGKFLREMPAIRQNSYRRAAAALASATGTGWIGVRLAQARPLVHRGEERGLVVEPVKAWGSWADEIWRSYRTECSFAVVRDRSTLEILYPLAEPRLTACLVSKGSSPVGWAAWLNTPMRDDQHFGNLHVATILDCVGPPEYADAIAHRVTGRVAESGADLIVLNQAHALWVRAFRRAGFVSAASNYLLATSRGLSAAILSGGGDERVHLTRGDGDGRIHL